MMDMLVKNWIKSQNKKDIAEVSVSFVRDRIHTLVVSLIGGVHLRLTLFLRCFPHDIQRVFLPYQQLACSFPSKQRLQERIFEIKK